MQLERCVWLCVRGRQLASITVYAVDAHIMVWLCVMFNTVCNVWLCPSPILNLIRPFPLFNQGLRCTTTSPFLSCSLGWSSSSTVVMPHTSPWRRHYWNVYWWDAIDKICFFHPLFRDSYRFAHIENPLSSPMVASTDFSFGFHSSMPSMEACCAAKIGYLQAYNPTGISYFRDESVF